jgi:hypothetical protein
MQNFYNSNKLIFSNLQKKSAKTDFNFLINVRNTGLVTTFVRPENTKHIKKSHQTIPDFMFINCGGN